MSNTVLITGASTGFGKLTAQRFQAAGWNVIATMRSPQKEAELTGLPNVLVCRLDVTDQGSIDAAVAEGVERFGGINAVVNNAGFGMVGLFEEASEEEFTRQFDTNVFGVIRVTQAVLPYMRRQRRGVVVNVSSIGGLVGMPASSLYCSTKFALEGLTESMAHELSAFGVRAYTVSPGAFKTQFLDSVQIYEGRDVPDLKAAHEVLYEHLQKWMDSPPKPFRFGDPQKVAERVFQCVTRQPNKTIHPVGQDARLILWLKGLLGRNRVLKMIRRTGFPELAY
ncbi:MAG: SDR family oxidoreductase [Planctomycetota bacterium]